MRAKKIITNLRVDDIEAAKDFYVDFLGLEKEEFNLGWVARFTSADGQATVQLVTRDETAAELPAISLYADDIERAYAQARERGYEIVHELTVEPWGVRRFMVRAPGGHVVNIVTHND